MTSPKKPLPASRSSELGFSLLEMLFATVILLVGLVGIAQLVPTSILLNQRGRINSSSLVFAQRELDQMLDQPFTLPNPPSFTDANGNICSLGDPSQPGVIVGTPVVVVHGQPLVNFSAASVPGYSFTYQDPNDPDAVTYNVRWAVITQTNGTATTSRRFIIGVSQDGGSGYVPPVTLDTMVSK